MGTVCDKCKKSIKPNQNPLKLKNKAYELCDRCISKVELWLMKPQGIKANFLDLTEKFGVKRE